MGRHIVAALRCSETSQALGSIGSLEEGPGTESSSFVRHLAYLGRRLLVTDHVDRRTRSKIMAKVKSKDTGPEMHVRSALHRAGHRFRVHRVDLPGRPDLVFPRHKVALFVHGCFWHSHGCRKSNLPKSNVEYWAGKIEQNVMRDNRVRHELECLGWKWRVIWQCEIVSGVEHLAKELRACPPTKDHVHLNCAVGEERVQSSAEQIVD